MHRREYRSMTEKKPAAFGSALNPKTPLLVSCRSKDGKNNALVVVYACNCSYDPPMIMVGHRAVAAFARNRQGDRGLRGEPRPRNDAGCLQLPRFPQRPRRRQARQARPPARRGCEDQRAHPPRLPVSIECTVTLGPTGSTRCSSARSSTCTPTRAWSARKIRLIGRDRFSAAERVKATRGCKKGTYGV